MMLSAVSKTALRRAVFSVGGRPSAAAAVLPSSSSSAGVRVRSYHELVVDHFENPRNVGSLDKNDPLVGTAVVGAPACGDVMKIQVKIVDGVVVDSKVRARGSSGCVRARVRTCVSRVQLVAFV
jgi:hypothetical protein